MTQVNRPVLQGSVAVELPTHGGGALGGTVWGNMELQNDNGRSWFPDGHAGRFTQIDLIANYQHEVGPFLIDGGVHNYNLPNGLEFENGERGATSEIFVHISTDLLGTTPYAGWHYDFDEVRSPYGFVGIAEGFELTEDFSLALDGSIAYAGSAQSAWLYGVDTSGFADLRGSVTLAYDYDERTTIEASINGSTIIDSRIGRWFDAINIDPEIVWGTIGVSWSF